MSSVQDRSESATDKGGRETIDNEYTVGEHAGEELQS